MLYCSWPVGGFKTPLMAEKISFSEKVDFRDKNLCKLLIHLSPSISLTSSREILLMAFFVSTS